MTRILVTGGAGYIGSVVAQVLLQRGMEVVVVDDLSRGHQHNVDSRRLHIKSIQDTDFLIYLMCSQSFDAVIHFAAYAYIGESWSNPQLYFRNNVAGTISLLEAMSRAGIERLVFSSSCSVYGIPARIPISEDLPLAPLSPYAESKALVERMLVSLDQTGVLRSIILRYFNACGADPESGIGEEHEPETHLIPLMLRATAMQKPITIFGEDYPTPDKTCIRDYVHVTDLAEAHVIALEALLRGGSSNAFNVGTGRGYSIWEVLQAVETVTGRKVPYEIGPRRPGDAPVLIANTDKIRSELGWRPRYTNIDEIVSTAWWFEMKRSAGI